MQPFWWALRVLIFCWVLGAFAMLLGPGLRILWHLPAWLPVPFFVGGVLLAILVYWLGWRSEEERIWGRYRRR